MFPGFTVPWNQTYKKTKSLDLLRDLLLKMLTINPDDRIDIEAVKSYPYFEGHKFHEYVRKKLTISPDANPTVKKLYTRMTTGDAPYTPLEDNALVAEFNYFVKFDL